MEQRTAERVMKWYGAIFFFIVVPIASFLLVMAYVASMPAYDMTTSYSRGSLIYATPLIPVGVMETFAVVIAGLSIVEGIFILKRAAFALTVSHPFAIFVIAVGVYAYVTFGPYSSLSLCLSEAIAIIFGLFSIYLFAFNKDVKALFQKSQAAAAKPPDTPPPEPKA